MTKIYLEKSSVKTSKQTLEMLSKLSEENTNPFATAFHRHRQGVSEGKKNRSIFSGKEQRHSIRKIETIIATKTAMDTDMVNIIQGTLFNKVEFPDVVPVEDLKHINF